VSLLAAELLKLRTTRVPFVLLAIVVVLSGLVAAALVNWSAQEATRADGLAAAASFWGMLVVVLGVLIVTNEYRHGTITTTFLAEPRRERVLAAKLAAALIAGAAIALAAAAVIALVALPWLAAKGQPLAVDGETILVLGRLVLAFALSAAFGAAVGAIIQSQVGTIVGVLVWGLIVESIIGLVAAQIFTTLGEPDPVSRYLPGSAIGGIVGGLGDEFLLGPGRAALVALAYVAGLSLLGAVAVRLRDPAAG
jgi:ABC-2 type transport system permease protein